MSGGQGKLAGVFAQLKLENTELRDRLASVSGANTTSEKLEHLERQLQRARNSYDAALHKRQQQVQELELLTMQCQNMVQTAGASTKQDALQRTAAQLETQLAATTRQLQCAASMQSYLQQAEQHRKNELVDVEAQVQALQDALAAAQDLLNKTKAKLLTTKSERNAARQALAAAEQRLAAGRATRDSLHRQLLQQCQECFASYAGEAGCPGSAWEDLMSLCAQRSRRAEPVLERGSCPTQLLNLVQNLVPQTIGDDGMLPGSVYTQHLSAAACSSVECLNMLFTVFGASSIEQLLELAQAELQANASLREALQALQDPT